MASFINEQILTNNLTIPSRELTNDIDNLILIKLKEQVEGICFEDGYIISKIADAILESSEKEKWIKI